MYLHTKCLLVQFRESRSKLKVLECAFCVCCPYSRSVCPFFWELCGLLSKSGSWLRCLFFREALWRCLSTCYRFLRGLRKESYFREFSRVILWLRERDGCTSWMIAEVPFSDLFGGASVGDDVVHGFCDDGPLLSAVLLDEVGNDLVLLSWKIGT